MTSNRWIETSRKLYAALLTLYPQEHRAEFGDPMRQVFSDQCRSAYAQQGAFGILLLWLRTLPDLGYSALLEHVTSPRAAWGLMEPVPNAPLPWKGVFLILLPGLVYLVSQVAQLVTGEIWYYFVYYRVTFLLIIPPLIAWGLTRRFPLWGLIPLGLVFRVTQEIGYQVIVEHPKLFSSNPFLELILGAARQVSKNQWFLIAPIVLVTLFLAVRYIRQQKPSSGFWLWLGVYLLSHSLQLAREIGAMMKNTQSIAPNLPVTQQKMLLTFVANELYGITAILLLVFIGTLFTRRHGFFAILIPIGYILPRMVTGLHDFSLYPNPTLSLAIFSAAILSYRLLLSLVAPIWMSRSSLHTSKKRSVLISIAAALTIHVVMQFYPVFLYPFYPIAFDWVVNTGLEELQLISAFLLAIAMYQNAQPKTNAPEAAPLQAAEVSAGQA